MAFRWRLKHKLATGLVLVVGMTLLLSAASFFGLRSYERSSRVFQSHHDQLTLLMTLNLAITELNYPSRDEIETIADREKSRRLKLARITRIDEMIGKYRTNLERPAVPTTSVAGLQKQNAALNKMHAYTQQLRSSVETLRIGASANKASDTKPWWYIPSEKDIISDLLTELKRLEAAIGDDVIKNVDADRESYSTSLAIVYGTSVLVLVMLAMLTWLGYRAIFQPMQQLHRGVTILGKGNFDSRVHLDSGDEMEELGQAFNSMADHLQGIYRDLNHQVEERSRQLIRSERLASVGFLAAGVAHEINNPLASIAFCGEALESRLQGSLPAESEDGDIVRNYLKMIQQEAFRCKAITEKLLDFSRAGEPERIETDMVGLVRSVIEMVEHLGRNHGKSIVFEPREAVIANVNPQELKQVLLNLVINALESVDEGGTVWLQMEQTPEKIRIAVRDNGCGMPPEVLANLFEPFFTRNRTGKGTGLGLSISHLIVSQHGGTLDASSDGPGKGSAFAVTLPNATRTRTLARAA